MKVINKTNKVVTLTNGRRIPAYESITITNPDTDLIEQISNLVRNGILEASF